MLLDEYLWRAPDDTVVKGVAHNLLNARPQYAAKEAETIAQAGRLGAVTIATNMAGRGTDILLGGNAEGLARRAMKEHLFEALGLGEVLKEERNCVSKRFRIVARWTYRIPCKSHWSKRD